MSPHYYVGGLGTATMMILDMHLHTTRAGPHSGLDPKEAIQEARRIGLNGICITEHDWSWEKWESSHLSNQLDFPVFRGMEINTDLGHIGVIGLDRYVGGIHKLSVLRKVADDMGAFLIALHPFRRVFDPLNGGSPATPPTLEEAASWPVFEYVDEIEVFNGASTEEENGLALEVCRRLGLKGTGGSDAHSVHGLGCFTTVFERSVRTEEEFLKELKARRFRPASGLLAGALAYYGVDPAETIAVRRAANEIEGEQKD